MDEEAAGVVGTDEVVRMTPRARRLYAALELSGAGERWVPATTPELQALAGSGRRTTLRALSELIALKLVERRQTGWGRGARGMYRVVAALPRLVKPVILPPRMGMRSKGRDEAVRVQALSRLTSAHPEMATVLSPFAGSAFDAPLTNEHSPFEIAFNAPPRGSLLDLIGEDVGVDEQADLFPAPARREKTPTMRMPEGWTLTPRMREIAARAGLVDADQQAWEFQKCRAFHVGKGSRFTEDGWRWAVWTTWIGHWKGDQERVQRQAYVRGVELERGSAARRKPHEDLDAGIVRVEDEADG